MTRAPFKLGTDSLDPPFSFPLPSPAPPSAAPPRRGSSRRLAPPAPSSREPAGPVSRRIRKDRQPHPPSPPGEQVSCGLAIPEELGDFFASPEAAQDFIGRNVNYTLKVLTDILSGSDMLSKDDYAITLHFLRRNEIVLKDIFEDVTSEEVFCDAWAYALRKVDDLFSGTTTGEGDPPTTINNRSVHGGGLRPSREPLAPRKAPRWTLGPPGPRTVRYLILEVPGPQFLGNVPYGGPGGPRGASRAAKSRGGAPPRYGTVVNCCRRR